MSDFRSALFDPRRRPNAIKKLMKEKMKLEKIENQERNKNIIIVTIFESWTTAQEL